MARYEATQIQHRVLTMLNQSENLEESSRIILRRTVAKNGKSPNTTFSVL